MTEFHAPPVDELPTQSVWREILKRGPELYDEYARTPTGAHSPDLQFILQHFRKAPCAGKFVLVAIEPHRKWALGTLTGTRGDPVIVDDTVTFDDLAEAERHVFRKRWIALTGIDPVEDA